MIISTVIYSLHKTITKPDFYCKKYTTDLEVAIQNPVPNFTSDNEVIYTVAVTNNGNEDAYNIQTQLLRSIATSYAAGSPPNMIVDYSADIINMSAGSWERLSGGNYVWYLSELGVGETATVDVIYHLDGKLEDLENELNPEEFFRANRQYLIQRTAIKNLSVYFNGRLIVNTLPKAKEQIIVSKANAPKFKAWLNHA